MLNDALFGLVGSYGCRPQNA